MALIFDGPTKIISLSTGTAQISVRELLSRWADWVILSDNIKYLPAFDQVGGNDIDVTVGTKIPIYGFLLNGWRIRPYEGNHTLIVNDGILAVAGGGDPFVNTIGNYVVRINYQQPIQAITVSTSGSGGGLTVQQSIMLEELWKIHALNPAWPLQVSSSSRTVDNISQQIVESPPGVVTMTRV